MMLPMPPATSATGATANVKRLLTVASTNVPIWDEQIKEAIQCDSSISVYLAVDNCWSSCQCALFNVVQ